MEPGNLFEPMKSVAAACGVELVEAMLEQRGRRQVVRLVIHRDTGVTHGDCERMTLAAGDAIDAQELVGGSYVLEVSSPGLERVIKGEREFDLFRGKRVRLRLQAEPEAEIVGVCDGTREGHQVALRGADGGEQVFAWMDVARARLDPEGLPRSEGRGT
jgi:ribosome maturation factor RimP